MSSQSTLGLLPRPGNFNLVQRVKDAVQDITPDIGVSLDAFTARPGDLSPSTGVLRYQYSTVYDFYTRGSDGDTKIGNVQFRTTVYTLTDPSDEFKRYLRNVNHHRLRALFETTSEYRGYMSGFGFIKKDSNEENAEPVGQDEIPPTGLGVPNYSVEVYDHNGDLLGYSKGFSLDFGVSKTQVRTPDAPEQEVWRMGGLNKARNDYEIKPKARTPARERARKAKGKTVYVNGMPVGEITSRGTVWLSREHKAPERATYRSRKYIIENTGTPYQALQPNAKFYKVRETPDALYFSTVEPQDFSAVDPDDVSPDQTGFSFDQTSLDTKEDEPTEFVVTADVKEQWAMGKYDATLTREIDKGTDFTIQSSGGRRR